MTNSKETSAYQAPMGFYTLERGAERTHQALCGQHFEDRLDDLEYDGFKIVAHVRAPHGSVCSVCREFNEQTKAEINARTA